MLEEIRRLYAHAAWADEAVLGALTRAGDATPFEVPEIFGHVVGAELVWLSRLRNEPPPVAVWPEATLDTLRDLVTRSREGFAEYLAGLSEAGLDTEVRYVNSAGRAFTSRVSDILVHAALHGAYHRGQVALLLRQAGLEPAPTDYIAFVRGAPSATRG
jgi:uncharacterized damage-inducible protein DinB